MRSGSEIYAAILSKWPQKKAKPMKLGIRTC